MYIRVYDANDSRVLRIARFDLYLYISDAGFLSATI